MLERISQLFRTVNLSLTVFILYIFNRNEYEELMKLAERDAKEQALIELAEIALESTPEQRELWRNKSDAMRRFVEIVEQVEQETQS